MERNQVYRAFARTRGKIADAFSRTFADVSTSTRDIATSAATFFPGVYRFFILVSARLAIAWRGCEPE
jgi:hypothetical protein